MVKTGNKRESLVVASLFTFWPMATATADVVFVSSLGTDEVLRYDFQTGTYQTTLIPAQSGGLAEPHGLLDSGTDLLVTSFGSDQVLRYDRATGAFLGIFIDAPTGLDAPTCIAVGPDGNLYISSQVSDEILRYAPNGALIDDFVAANSGGLDGPSGLAFGPDGRLYVASRYSAEVLVYNGASGAFEETIADSIDGLGFGTTFGLNFDDAGDLYFASGGSVFRYSLSTESIVASVSAGFPIGLERGPDGAIYVATGNNLRRYITATNTLSAPLLTGGSISTLNFFHFAAGHCVLCRGDFDQSGKVDEPDIIPFTTRLLDESGPNCADLNNDGQSDARDLDAFIAALLSQSCG